jgi:hypothetical protein
LLICMDLCNWIACLQSSLLSTYSFAIIIMIETDHSWEHHHNRTCLLFQHDGHHDWTEQYFFHHLAMDSLILARRSLLGWLRHSCPTNVSNPFPAQLTAWGMLVDGAERWRWPHVRTILIVTYGPKQWKRSIDV